MDYKRMLRDIETMIEEANIAIIRRDAKIMDLTGEVEQLRKEINRNHRR